jgi:LysM repeat protein
MILSVHVVVIGGMLLQGCKDTSTKDLAKDSIMSPSNDMTTTTSTTPIPTGLPVDMPTTINPNMSNVVAGATASAGPMPPPSSPNMANPLPPARSQDLAPAAAQGEGKEYVIVRGDTLAVIAHKNNLALKALEEANPNVNPKKLQIGQKLQIPAGTASVAATSTPGAASSVITDTAPADGSSYVVKSGDTLMKIAKNHGTSFKKIMAMNDLKSTSIRAGQKLKLPAPKASTAEPAAAPATAPASASTTTSPARSAAVTPVTTSPVAAN